MLNVRVAIVGGGLSGLYAASLLERAGFNSYCLIEARDRLGGRILSPAANPKEHAEEPWGYGLDRVDLGPTWFWPAYHRELQHLIQSLKLATFTQHLEGDNLVERSASGPPIRVRGCLESLTSMRVVGGMGALIHAVSQKVSADRVRLGWKVRDVRLDGHRIELEAADSKGQVSGITADHVLLAVPPRLVAENIVFTPDIASATRKQWHATPTWMAPHAKYVATFGAPFWRDEGLSGEARSVVGPLGEIHDASMQGGHAALFGFLSVPATVRRRYPVDLLRAQCRAQLARLFGRQAGMPLNDWMKDWAADSLTAAASDLDAGMHGHALAPHPEPAGSPWAGRLTGIASEWSRDFPGYVAGAIDAATRGIDVVRPLMH